MYKRLLFCALAAFAAIGCADSPTQEVSPPHVNEPLFNITPITWAQTSTGYFYPLGTPTFYTGCPHNGGTWLGRPSPNGCYIPGLYHLGYDFFNSGTGFNSPVFAISTGEVIYIDPNNSWNNDGTNNNTAVLVKASTASGRSYVVLYGHILRSGVRVQIGDIVTAGTQIGVMGQWYSPPHVHVSVWPDRSTLPLGPWGNKALAYYPEPYGHTDPVAWITDISSSAKCQNGGTVYYSPNGGTPTHPNGTLFTVKGDPQPGTVYVLHNGQTRGIPTAQLLYQLYGVGRGFDFRDVIQISMAEFNTYNHGPPLNAPLPHNGMNEPDGRLIRQWGGSEVSIVTNNGQRRPFASGEAFFNLGYQPCNIAGVSDYYSYTPGAPITQ